MMLNVVICSKIMNIVVVSAPGCTPQGICRDNIFYKNEKLSMSVEGVS